MLTPLDIKKKEFRRCFRGYDEQEVDTFLDQVIATVEELVGQNQRLQDQLERSEHNISRYQEIEDALKQTMVFAQKNAQELKSNVEKEAEVILQEAHAQAGQIAREAARNAEQIIVEAERRSEELLRGAHRQAESSLEEAHRRVDQLLREYQQIEKQVKVFRAKFRSFLHAQLDLLDDVGGGIGKEVDLGTLEPTMAEDVDKAGDEEAPDEGEDEARLA